MVNIRMLRVSNSDHFSWAACHRASRNTQLQYEKNMLRVSSPNSSHLPESHAVGHGPTPSTSANPSQGSQPPTCPAVACRSPPSPTGRCCSWVFGRHPRAPVSSLGRMAGRRHFWSSWIFGDWLGKEITFIFALTLLPLHIQFWMRSFRSTSQKQSGNLR